MSNETLAHDLGEVVIGDLTCEQLRSALHDQQVGLNENAEALLARAEMATPVTTLQLVTLTPADLGFPEGAPLGTVYEAAVDQGFRLCPLATGPYLRLVHREDGSDDPELRRHRPPEGALHVASPVLDPDYEVPKGFYLPTVSGQRWLRGYRCDDEYVVPPETVYVFALAEGATRRMPVLRNPLDRTNANPERS